MAVGGEQGGVEGTRGEALLQRAWMLEAVAVFRPQPAAGAEEQAAGAPAGGEVQELEKEIRRLHPVGRTFVEFRADGTFSLLRGGQERAGTYYAAGGQLTLSLETQAEEQVARLPYALELLEAERLVLRFNLEERSAPGGFLLHFIPSQWSLEQVRGRSGGGSR